MNNHPQVAENSDQSLTPTIIEIERWFGFFQQNLQFKQRKLPRPVITIQTGGSRRQRVLGWFAPKAWNLGDDTFVPEINVVAEHLQRGTYEIANILVHEMVHLSNFIAGDRDCSSNGYHNKKFKNLAEQVGLLCEKADDGKNRYGFAYTKASDWLKEVVDKMRPNEAAFSLFRDMQFAKKPEGEQWSQDGNGEPKLKKWSCGCTNVWSAVEVHAFCTAPNCGGAFRRSKVFLN